MEKTTLYIFGVLAIGVVAVVLLAPRTSEDDRAMLTMGFGALFGLCSIAFTQHLNARAALDRDRKERLQGARGLAHALAAEINIFGNVLLAKGHTLQSKVGTERGPSPDDLLRFIELPSRVIFDANASKISLLDRGYRGVR